MAASTPTYRLITTSRIYCDVSGTYVEGKDPFGNFALSYGDIDRFQVIHPVGSGKYSLVFKGTYDGDKLCAIKTLKNIPMSKIQREVAILQHVAHIPNVIHLISVVRDPLTATISIVTDFLQSDSPRKTFPKLEIPEIRKMLWQLLNSLNCCARVGVMHRDVKPGNMLISRDNCSIQLIDWGLADLYFPERAYTVRVSTMRYKAPELLLNYQYYDYGVDVWGAGVVFAEMLVKFPFFEGRDIDEMVAGVAGLCGTNIMQQYVEKYGLVVSQQALAQFPHSKSSGWHKVVRSIKRNKANEDAIDLMKKLLTVDHAVRITAAEALEHPFFGPIREEKKGNTKR
jgi:casein kinase II subunit alpha